ncbi:MAG: hypothetical protein ACRDYX_13360 [Egibacteraceae bacterium]
MDEQHRQAKRIPQPQPQPQPAAPAAPPVPSADLVEVGEWTGGLATALRRAWRETVYDFAARTGVGPSTVDAWDKSPAVVPRSRMQKELDRALEDAPCKVKKRFGMLARGKPVVEVPDSSGLDGNGGDTNRAQALKAVGSLLVAAAVPEEVVERIIGDRAGRVDAGLLDGYERVARSLAADMLGGDARAVVPAALANADDALGLLHRQVADRPRLDALVVGVNARVALWAFHRGDLRAARKHLLVAWGLAAESGDPGLLAQAIGMSSVLYSTHSGCCEGDPERALERLDQAGALAVHADPHTRLWVAIWHADEAAAVGDVRASRVSLDAAGRARELLGDDPDAGGRIGFLVYGLEQQLETARVNMQMLAGRFAEADRRFDAVLRSAMTVHHRVIILAQIGRVRAKAGQPDGACEALLTGLDLAEPVGYTMGVERARGVRGGFPKRWARLSCVRKLDERLGLR